MKIKTFARICKNPAHKHIFAQHNRIVVNHYKKGRKVIRVSTCNYEKNK